MQKTTNLETYKKIRKLTGKALEITLKKLLQSSKPISEIKLRDEWLKELRKNKDLFPDGWYSPPPHGVAVLFSTDEKVQRSLFTSLRFKDFYPRKDIFLDRKKGVVLAYASPVDKKTGMIGDFGITLYFGKSKKIIAQIKEVLKIQKQVLDYSKVGMSFSQLYKCADGIFKKTKFSNDWWVNVTDPSGRNMGHTIPGAEGLDTKDLKSLQNFKKWQDALTLISKRRIFLSPAVSFKIKKGMAFTIEPRLKSSDPSLPIVWFHTVGVINQNGEKEFLTDYKNLFKLAKMNYAL